MKKAVSAVLLTAIFAALCVAFCGCGLLYDSGYRKGPAMWMVEDADGHICYLLGSIHVGKDDSLFPFADIIEDAYKSCDQLALEYDMIEAENQKKDMDEREYAEYYAKIFMYNDGTTIKDHISEETYKAAVEYLKNKEIYREELDYFNAAYWYMLLDNIQVEEQGAGSDNGVDIYFANKAYKEGKKVVSIESEQAQIDMLNSVNDLTYDYFIQSTVQGSSSIFGESFGLNFLMSMYKRGNMTAMERLISSGRTVDYKDEKLNEAMKDYDKKMYSDRNRIMADAVKQFLSEGKKTFVVVGCAHMLCNDGIVALLSNEGYTVIRK
ncbi:MAG: TraB/GumN family protein [Clostridia bacterium]|nr:TraB/GumN family protein [Clostridia bacterium]